MRLTFDLRFVQTDRSRPPDERRVDLSAIVAAVRAPAPRRLARLLWERRYDSVRIELDDTPLTGVQAVILLLAGLGRARVWELQSPWERRVARRLPFLGLALSRLAVALPRELRDTVALYRLAREVAGTPFALPRGAAEPRSVLYVRTESILHDMRAYVGGAATHTNGVINGFAANGLDVQVFAPERPDEAEGVRFHEVPLRRVYHLVHWLTSTAYSEEVAAAAASHRADFVYHRSDLGSYAGLVLAERLRVPLVLEFNGSEIWTATQWGAGALPLARALAELERRNLEDASLVVVVSDVLRDQLVERGIPGERVLVNPNGVDVARLAPLRKRPPADWRRLTGRPEAPTVGFVGSFGLWHGVKLLPRLIERVAEERPDARWILIGAGRLHGEVREEIEARDVADKVFLTGIVPHARALELLAACDVCVAPHVPNPDGSRFFGSPTKLFEYMGLGKAIVASALEQIGEVLEHERTALLCPPGHVDSAAGGIVRLLGDERLRERLGRAALREAEERYSWESHTRRILDALRGD